ncbi:cilia- and flagella-associated protein 251-like [Haliotis rubra]|uniref:cilia- and flagella-associated protein 251-like n=1 Tax=Haliotis rubra TaxID=36100 RepID=UPI001EE56A74|nr:cilia- and flagella-associated protein 251-like [Haliotis rubra]
MMMSTTTVEWKEKKEVQAALQEGMKHLFSTMFGLPVVERKEKKDLSNGSPDKEEQPAEQMTTDKDTEEPFPEAYNKTAAGSFDKQMDVEEERSEEEKEQEDTCLMLKYDEKPSLRHDTSDIGYVEEQTTADSAPPEQTTDQNTEEDEDVESLMSDGEEDAESILIKADENLPVSSSSQDFEIRFDLSKYKPEDIRVVVRNGDVIVEAERESQCDGYSETESLQRRIRLPDKVDLSMLTSILNSEGEMTIQAPFQSQTISGKEDKTIPVVWE